MKMYSQIRILILLFSVISFCTGCQDDDPVDPATKANIIGSVNLYDEGINPLSKDGMKVFVAGSNPLISTFTDAEGSFVLPGIPFGTYTLSFEKSGFGKYNQVGVVHSNKGSSTVIMPSPSLGQLSTTTITSLTSTSGLSNSKLTITTTPAPVSQAPRYIRVFYSKSPSVSFFNYLKYSTVYKHPSNPADLVLGIKDLQDMGFSAGDIVYARVYGDSFWSNDYDNPATGKHEFPNLNAATFDAVSFIVP